MTESDKKAIACNILAATSVFAKGAKAYVNQLPGGSDRIYLRARSRSGRWVSAWLPIKNVGNFRHVSIPPQHPRYGDRSMWFCDTPLEVIRERAAGAVGADAPTIVEARQ